LAACGVGESARYFARTSRRTQPGSQRWAGRRQAAAADRYRQGDCEYGNEFLASKVGDQRNQFPPEQAQSVVAEIFRGPACGRDSRIFVPLCGKSLDVDWLLSNGHRVAGAELSELAVAQLFANLELEPSVEDIGGLRRYTAGNLEVFVGNIFDLSRELLGPVDATYDRAALVALPAAVRARYAAQLRAITNDAPQLLICFEYDQSVLAGPPFSVTGDEVNRCYGGGYAGVDVPGGLKGKCAASEVVWLLQHT
jgi:thiopurine S-methyltransferase